MHASTILNRRRNLIGTSKDDEGAWVEDRESMARLLVQKFTMLYASSNPEIPDYVQQLFHPCVDARDNEAMCRIPSQEEIVDVVLLMNPFKAPRPDSMPALFYQRYWAVVKDSVAAEVQAFFSYWIYAHRT